LAYFLPLGLIVTAVWRIMARFLSKKCGGGTQTSKHVDLRKVETRKIDASTIPKPGEMPVVEVKK